MSGDIGGTTAAGRGWRGAPRAATTKAIALTLAVVMTALVAGLAACGGGDASSGAAVYTESDNGRTVGAAVGDSITIRLSENASTGYSWTLRRSVGLSLLVDDLEQPTASPGLVGAPGTRVFTLEVTATGTQMAQAVYARSWETEGDAGRREFMLTIEVE